MLLVRLRQTPCPHWGADGLNLCNSRGLRVDLRLYASASGPLFGAQCSSESQGFRLLKTTGARVR